jgi:hypothetical protein
MLMTCKGEIMKFLVTAVLLSILAMPVVADRQHPIGAAMVITDKSKDYKFGVTYDLATVGGKSSDVHVNLGPYVAQLDNGRIDRLVFGPQVNAEFRRAFAGVGYDVSNKRVNFLVGVKF